MPELAAVMTEFRGIDRRVLVGIVVALLILVWAASALSPQEGPVYLHQADVNRALGIQDCLHSSDFCGARVTGSLRDVKRTLGVERANWKGDTIRNTDYVVLDYVKIARYRERSEDGSHFVLTERCSAYAVC